jgi:hypothetical protein
MNTCDNTKKTQFIISFQYIISLSNLILNFWSWDSNSNDPNFNALENITSTNA